MKFAGIIAEYDPFHNGHAWQLAQAKALGAEHVAVAMSCGLTQRGSLPLLPEAVRVQAALQGGADLIFALPAPCACAGAEAFARARRWPHCWISPTTIWQWNTAGPFWNRAQKWYRCRCPA